MSINNEITIEINPTVFPQYNAKNKLADGQVTTMLKVKRLKHGHLRAMQKLGEHEQIHYLMSELTGVSESDLDELDVEDSAKLSEVIFGFMHGYAKIAKDMARG